MKTLRLVVIMLLAFCASCIMAQDEVLLAKERQTSTVTQDNEWKLVSAEWRSDFLGEKSGGTLKRYQMISKWPSDNLRIGQDHTQRIRKDGCIGKSPLQSGEMYMSPSFPVKGLMYFKSLGRYVDGFSIDEVVVQKDPILTQRWERIIKDPKTDSSLEEVYIRQFFWVRCHGICRNDYPTIAVQVMRTTVKLPDPIVRNEKTVAVTSRVKTREVNNTTAVQSQPADPIRSYPAWGGVQQPGPVTYLTTQVTGYFQSGGNRKVQKCTPNSSNPDCQGNPPELGNGPEIPPPSTPPNTPEYDLLVPGTGPTGGPSVYQGR